MGFIRHVLDFLSGTDGDDDGSSHPGNREAGDDSSHHAQRIQDVRGLAGRR
jgi:hypothetical protein